MRYLITILILIVIGQKIYADYVPTPLPQLILDSDLILHGKIIHHDSMTFTLVISDLIKGDYNHNSIQIQKFEDWTCTSRIPEYQIGQEVIVFLKKNDKTNGWNTIGAANEGEFLVKNDSVLYKDIYYESNSGCEEIEYYGFKICGWIYSMTDFKDGILFYLKEYPLLNKQYKINEKITNGLKENNVYERIIYEMSKYLIFEQ